MPVSTSLPDRSDLAQLRRQAKELRDAARRQEPVAVDRFARHHRNAPGDDVTLAAAQLVIARELGFPSWPRLKAAVAAQGASPAHRTEAFVAASVQGRMREAVAIFHRVPDVASHSLAAAAVLGDARQVAQLLAAKPAAAATIDAVRGWPPLLYACYSRWYQIDPWRAAGLAEVVRLLLDAGASPNTNDGARYPRAALKGSVEASNPDMTRILLEAGANPDVGQPIGEAVGRGDHRCLELLLSYGARVAGTWAVGAAVYHDDAGAVALLLAALGSGAAHEATDALPDAAANASPEVVTALLTAGADPAASDEHGFSALRIAVRSGQNETAAILASRGTPDDSTDIDSFLGACRRADRPAAEQLVAGNPGLRDRLTDDDRAVVLEAASSAVPGALKLMLDLGFSPHVRNGLGEQPLHTASYAGQAEAVRYLLEAGADVDARDTRFDGTPLAFATVGSREQAGKAGNWLEVVRQLVAAGASRHGVWIAAKPPSEEVIDLLRSYGISPDDEPETEPEGTDDPPLSIGTGVMADIAGHLEVAYRGLDLELLGSLLHPDVRWSGVCSTSAEVLDWYRRLLADGTQATVESVEVDGDAVVIGISVTGRAEGTRPAPAERLFQVFTVDNDEIVEIRGYPDRTSALARTRS
jgi:ankyrin repeat protein